MFDDQGRLIIAFCQDCEQSYQKLTLLGKEHECEPKIEASPEQG